MKSTKDLNTARPRRSSRQKATPLKITKILAPTDFSEESRQGVRFAMSLASNVGASVALLHVIEPPSLFSGMESVVLARTETEMIRLARTHLSALAKREAGKRVKATYSVRTGKPFHEIAAEAEESGSYLIVLASHGYTGAQRVLMGSTAERVVRHAHCPVLTVPTRNRPKSSGHGDAFRVKKILVPLDFSDLSQDALPWAVSLAIEHDAELILLHVVEKYPIDYLVGEELAKHSIAPLKKRARSSLDRLAEIWGREGTIPVSVAVREGNPYEEICQLAKMVCADLIVQTTHGYTGLSHVWLGSTAERVVRHATCPVLTVRATKPEKR